MRKKPNLKNTNSVLEHLGQSHPRTMLTTRYGNLNVTAHGCGETYDPILSITASTKNISDPTFVRLHSACLFGESFLSDMCDCRQQLSAALKEAAIGCGVVIYMPQEGRGAGLCAKILGMELERVSKIDTASAFRRLGLEPDQRDYRKAISVMRELRLPNRLRLMTNNPHKMNACVEAGYEIVERVELPLNLPVETQRIVRLKQKSLGHFINTHPDNTE